MPSISTPLIRVCAVNGTNLACVGAISRPRMSKRSLASTTMERPSGVSSESEASCAASARSRSLTPGAGMNATACRSPKRDRASLVEQQHIDVASRFHRAARGGEHVEAHQTVHAGDADGGEQPANRGGDQRDEQRRQRDDADAAACVGREAPERWRPPARRSAKGRPAEPTARFRSASSCAPRLRPTRSCGQERSSLAPPSRARRCDRRERACRP